MYYVVYHTQFHDNSFVAVVRAKNLEEVYRDTNSINNAWWENENVGLLQNKEGFRSTSVGDYVIDENGKVFRVDSYSFEEVDINEEIVELRYDSRAFLDMYEEAREDLDSSNVNNFIGNSAKFMLNEMIRAAK